MVHEHITLLIWIASSSTYGGLQHFHWIKFYCRNFYLFLSKFPFEYKTHQCHIASRLWTTIKKRTSSMTRHSCFFFLLFPLAIERENFYCPSFTLSPSLSNNIALLYLLHHRHAINSRLKQRNVNDSPFPPISLLPYLPYSCSLRENHRKKE